MFPAADHWCVWRRRERRRPRALQRAGHLVGIIMKGDDRGDEVGELVGDDTALRWRGELGRTSAYIPNKISFSTLSRETKAREAETDPHRIPLDQIHGGIYLLVTAIDIA
jgi:hypothetical protein